jgi:uncharacterized membrane protein YfcA
VNFEIVASPWFWLVAIVAVTISGISKGGGLSGGAGTVATPLMAIVVSPAQSAAIMLPVLCAMDLASIQAYLRHWDRRIMRVILPAGLVGCGLGTVTFRELNDNWIRVLLGSIALGFLANNLLPRRRIPNKPSRWHGYFWATLSGFTSFVAHSGVPPLLAYLLPQKLDKTAFIATSVIFFGAINYAKIVPYVWLGLFDARNLATSLLLIPVGVLATYLGVLLQTRINPRLFFRIVYVLLFCIGVKLLYEGITRLSGRA